MGKGKKLQILFTVCPISSMSISIELGRWIFSVSVLIKAREC